MKLEILETLMHPRWNSSNTKFLFGRRWHVPAGDRMIRRIRIDSCTRVVRSALHKTCSHGSPFKGDLSMTYALRVVFVSFVGFCIFSNCAPADESGFESIFDGKSLAGWKVNERPESWSVVDGQIVAKGERSHLFYIGPNAEKPVEFKNFHFKAEVMTKPKANSGIYFHTKFQPEGWPDNGYEAQVNNSQGDPVHWKPLQCSQKSCRSSEGRHMVHRRGDGEWKTDYDHRRRKNNRRSHRGGRGHQRWPKTFFRYLCISSS